MREVNNIGMSEVNDNPDHYELGSGDGIHKTVMGHMTILELVRGNKYRFKNQTDLPDLMYVGKDNPWHQFVKFEDGRFGKIWSELLDSDFHLLEIV